MTTNSRIQNHSVSNWPSKGSITRQSFKQLATMTGFPSIRNILTKQNQTQKIVEQKIELIDARRKLRPKKRSPSFQKLKNFRTATAPQRSIFLNFQKHLITTLKRCIKLRGNNQSDSISYLASKMWYFAKNILFFMFGYGPEVKSCWPQAITEIFQEVTTLYPQQEIKLAQEYLRDLTVRQCKQLMDDELFQNRRIRAKQKFRDYFKHFIIELESGKISRRFPKSAKNSMGQRKSKKPK